MRHRKDRIMKAAKLTDKSNRFLPARRGSAGAVPEESPGGIRG